MKEFFFFFLWSSSRWNKQKKKRKRKKNGLQELEWATAHFPVLGHDTGDCIVTQGLGGSAGARSGAA